MPMCDGLTVVVTGAARGIGRAHVLELARQGAACVINDIDPSVSDTAELVRAKGGSAEVHIGDVADWNQAHALINLAHERFGRLDALVNNAGILRNKPMVEFGAEEWSLVVSTHINGTFFPSHAAIEYWQSQPESTSAGSLICTTSKAGVYGMPGLSPYSTAKSAIAGFVLATSRELAASEIRVNGIAPSAFTAMSAEFGAPPPADEFDRLASSPDNISPLVAWLASEESVGVTGRIFEVSYGHVALVDSWQPGAIHDQDTPLRTSEIPSIVGRLIEQSGPVPPYPA